MKYPKIKPIMIAIVNPIKIRPMLLPTASMICPLMIPLNNVSNTCVRLGNMKSGRLESLDVTSHIPAIIAMNMIRLKAVIIPHFLLQHFFNFLL